jgi:hypothetical protein
MTPDRGRKPYVPGCKHDLFISYAHIDDQPLTDEKKTWVAEFHRLLETRLSQALGQWPAIFRDPTIQGNDYFSDLLLNTLPEAAILVAVLSPGYLKSDWCLRELEGFCRATRVRGDLRIEEKSRIFKVIKTFVPPERHPLELQGLEGYQFFQLDPLTRRPAEFLQGSPEFWKRMDDLLYDIEKMLNLLCDMQPIQADPLYLAETTSDLDDRRDRLRRVFREEHVILPDRPLPLKMPEVKTQISSYLDRARLSVHLVGEPYGIVPEGAAESITCLQTELAARSGFLRVIWVPPGLHPTDRRQQEFLDRLRNQVAGEDGVEYVESSLDEVEKVVRDKLVPRAAPVSAPVPTHRSDTVYIVCAPSDYPAVESIADYLFGRGFETILAPSEGDEREFHKQSLLLCDAVLIYWGTGTEPWLRTKLKDLQKTFGYGRTDPFRARAVYVAAPPDAAKDRFRTHEAAVLRPSRTIEDDLAAFVRAIEETH